MFRPIETVETSFLTSSSPADAREKIIECLRAQDGQLSRGRGSLRLELKDAFAWSDVCRSRYVSKGSNRQTF